MNKLRNASKIVGALLAVVLVAWAHVAFAQSGTLHGSNMVLSNGTNAITITTPGSNKTWTLTLPNDTATGTQYLYDDGTGTLHWGAPASDTSTGTVLYGGSGPQTLTAVGSTLFNIGYSTAATGPAVGALIKVVGNGASNSTYSGLTDTARNVKTSNINPGTVTGLIDTVGNLGNGTQIGIQVTVSGSGTNYAAIATGGNVGIGTGTPGEQLEVNGNIRISGQNGLKITEGTNATMGTVTLNNGTATVSTTKVTANSRIFLTTQSANNIGKICVSARTAGTSFTIKSTSNTDASTVAWLIIEP